MIVNIYNLLYYLYTYLSFIKVLSKYNTYRKTQELSVYTAWWCSQGKCTWPSSGYSLCTGKNLQDEGLHSWVLIPLLSTWNPRCSAQMAIRLLPGPTWGSSPHLCPKTTIPKPCWWSSGGSSLWEETKAQTQRLGVHTPSKIMQDSLTVDGVILGASFLLLSQVSQIV